MTVQYINTGTAPNQGNGDTLRKAFTKANANFKLFENLQGMNPATTSTAGAVVIGAGLSVNTQTGLISTIFDGSYSSLTNQPNPQNVLGGTLGLSSADSPTFNGLEITGGNVDIGSTIGSDSTLSINAEIGTPPQYTGIDVNYNVDAYTQVMLQNHTSGLIATSDLIIPRDDGGQITNMIDLGINSSGYSETEYSLQTPGSGYLFTNGADLFIGTQSSGTKLHFHAGGTTLNDSGGFLDAYAWNFNRSVNITVANPGALNFTVQNVSADSAATAVYQALNDGTGSLVMGVTSGYYVNTGTSFGSNLGANQAFIRASGTSSAMHVGSTATLYLYAAVETSVHYGLPALTLEAAGENAILDRNLIPFENEEYDLGSSTATWKSLYLSTGTIYMGGIPIEMNTLTNQLVVNGVPISGNSTWSLSSSTGATVSLTSNAPGFGAFELNTGTFLTIDDPDGSTMFIGGFVFNTSTNLIYSTNDPISMFGNGGLNLFSQEHNSSAYEMIQFGYNQYPWSNSGTTGTISLVINGPTNNVVAWKFEQDGRLEVPGAISSITSSTIISSYLPDIGGPFVGSVVVPCASNGYLTFGGPVGNESLDLLAGIDLSRLAGATLVQGGISTDIIYSVTPAGTPGWYVFAMSGGIANGDGYVGTTLTIIPLASKVWTFETNGSLKFPDNSVQLSAYTGAYTPTTPANWVGSPTVATVTLGLDELAQRVTTLAGISKLLTFADDTAANLYVGTPTVGMLYYDTTLDKAKVYTPGGWQAMN